MGSHAKLQSILSAVQIDPGIRGLSPLFALHPDDFENACKQLAGQNEVDIITGFYIPGFGAFETDGPLGALYLWQALSSLKPSLYTGRIRAEHAVISAISAVCPEAVQNHDHQASLGVWIERAGPALDNRCYTMRGIDITDHIEPTLPTKYKFSIGVGDGGNEIGMGKIPHDLIAWTIPLGDRIHCRVTTDHLIVAGVSNWGAYALAAGVAVLMDRRLPEFLLDLDHERKKLERMVDAGPLIDGVTGRRTATVDGLDWDTYIQPLAKIREILT